MAKSQPNRVSRAELRKLVTRPWCWGTLQEQGARRQRMKKKLCQGDWGLVTVRGEEKEGFDKITFLHYYSGKSLQRRPSSMLSSLHVNRAECVYCTTHRNGGRTHCQQPCCSLYSIYTIWWRKGHSGWEFLKTVTWLAHLKITENRTIR